MNLTIIEIMLEQFAAARDWEQYHTPANLAQAMAIEVAELQELYLWGKNPAGSIELAEEAADIGIYLIRFCDIAGIDLEQAILDKIEKNSQKYPADQVKGSAEKYTKYQQEFDV